MSTFAGMEIQALCGLFNGKARTAAVKKLLAGSGMP
jgi:hypothetical protein